MNIYDKIKELNKKVTTYERLNDFLETYNEAFSAMAISIRDINGSESTVSGILTKDTVKKIMDLIAEEKDSLASEIETASLDVPEQQPLINNFTK